MKYGENIGEGAVISYSFINQVGVGLNPLINEQHQELVRNGFAAWSEIANIEFIEDHAGTGQIAIATRAGGVSNGGTNGDTGFFNIGLDALNAGRIDVVIHEIGHALGLKHPGNYNGDCDPSTGKVCSPPPYLPESEDSTQYSIMAVGYRQNPGTDVGPTTPMLYDIQAIQYLYGTNTDTRSEGNVYSWDPKKAFTETIWDTDGTDMISAAFHTLDATINLTEGTFSSIGPRANDSDVSAFNNLAIAYGVEIENASGGYGNDTIFGNTSGNYLYGSAGDDLLNGLKGNDRLHGASGNDVLDGGLGIDFMNGGSGDDTYYVDNDKDTVRESSIEGIDKVYSSISYALGENVENLSFAYAEGNLNGFGNSLNNRIDGNSFANQLSGALGDDTLIGWLGNDTLQGESGNDLLDGGFGNDDLFGWSGDDTLDGGAGADHLIGGIGDDLYMVDNYGDQTSEFANGGIDTVESYLNSFGLTDHIENLHLKGTSAIKGFGNASHNHLTGNSQSNFLSGLAGQDTLKGLAGDDTLNGGSGDDRMYGDLGNDTYIVHDENDVVVELAEEGQDHIYSYTDYSLSQNIENLTLQGVAISGYGNHLDNSLTGNSIDNFLSSGSGNDTLLGLGGNDSLYGSSGEDHLLGGEGNDSLYGQLGNDTVNGEAGQDFLYGDDGNDILNGGIDSDLLVGGKGSDILTGGTGNDQFRFYSLSEIGDTIQDFSISEGDQIQFIAQGFDSDFLASGLLDESMFSIGSSATRSSDRFIYNSAEGNLYFDPDGTGSIEKILLATLTDAPTLASNSIFVFA